MQASRPRDDGSIESRCNCESWNKYGPHCKHVVAAALVYLARVRSAAGTDRSAAVAAVAPEAADAAAPAAAPAALPVAADPVSLPALAKLENWLGLSALPDLRVPLPPHPHRRADRRPQLDRGRAPHRPGRPRGRCRSSALLTAGTRIAPGRRAGASPSSPRHEVRYDSKLVLNDEELADLLDLLRRRKVIYRGTALVFGTEPARPIIRLQSRPDGATARIERAAARRRRRCRSRTSILVCGRRTWVLAGQHALPAGARLPAAAAAQVAARAVDGLPDLAARSGAVVLRRAPAALPHERCRPTASTSTTTTEPRFVLTLEGRPDQVKAQLAARYGTHGTGDRGVRPAPQHLGYASGGTGEQRKLYLRQRGAGARRRPAS